MKRSVVFGAGLALLLAGNFAHGQGIGDNLLAYWPLDQTEGDVIENFGGDGIVGDNFDAEWVEDEGRTALSFDRSLGTYVNTNVFVPPLDVPESQFTWSFWGKNGAGNGNNDVVFGNRFGGDGSYRTFIKFTPTNFEYDRQDPGPENVALNNGAQMEQDVWLHHVVTKSGPVLTYYLDGEEFNVLELEDDRAVENPQPIYFGGDETNENWTGLLDDLAIWDRALDAGEVATLAAAGSEGLGSLLGALEPIIPPVAGRDTVGSRVLAGTRSNQVFGEAGPNAPGLGQSWYAVANPGNKAAVDAIFENNDRAVPYFQAESGITWWSGSMDVLDVPNYPTEVDGVITGDNYTVKLEGEILIEEPGVYRFLDGVDDYTFLAIDIDKSGVAGDSDGEVLIDDNSWTNALSTANGGAPIVEAEFTDIADDGEWLAIEFNMAEGGGGDHGMLYWDYNPDEGGIAGHEFFPFDQGEGLLDEDAAIFMIPDTHLRAPSTPPELLSADITGSTPNSPTGWEIDVNAADGTADAFVLENPDADVFTTMMNVDGLEVHVNAIGEVSEGASFPIIIADSIIGSLNVVTEGWSFDAATGSLVFGAVPPELQGDIDGDGMVGFPDFLILSANFSTAVAPNMSGDIDGDGMVGFPDFLILSANFGQSAAAAQSVPEPSVFAMLSVGLVGGLLRRRRR